MGITSSPASSTTAATTISMYHKSCHAQLVVIQGDASAMHVQNIQGDASAVYVQTTACHAGHSYRLVARAVPVSVQSQTDCCSQTMDRRKSRKLECLLVAYVYRRRISFCTYSTAVSCSHVHYAAFASLTAVGAVEFLFLLRIDLSCQNHRLSQKMTLSALGV